MLGIIMKLSSRFCRTRIVSIYGFSAYTVKRQKHKR